jgi:hypothetical protein
MKFNKWTVGLAAIGVVSLASAARADETKMTQVQTALSNTTLSGYVDVAAQWNPGTDSGAAVNQNIPAYAFAKNDGFSLNAVDIALDKPEDESPWASGYHVELMFGPNSAPASGGGNVANIRQAYLTLRTPVGNGIDWKVGVFDTIIGYESTSDPLNPNYTRSYGYTIEPTTHTGVLATYKVCDELSVSAGVADSSNIASGTPAINGTSTFESQKSYLGSIVLTAPDSFGAMKGATLTLGAINSVNSSQGVYLSGTRSSYYAGLTLPTPSSKVKFGAAFDYLNLNTAGNGGNNDDIWVVGLYTTIQPTDKLSFNLRGEIVDATEVGAGVNNLFPNQVLGGPAAYAGHYAGEITATVQYQLWANVLSRVEFRWDHVDGNAFGYGQTYAGGGATYSSPMKENDFLLALNLIYQF